MDPCNSAESNYFPWADLFGRGVESSRPFRPSHSDLNPRKVYESSSADRSTSSKLPNDHHCRRASRPSLPPPTSCSTSTTTDLAQHRCRLHRSRAAPRPPYETEAPCCCHRREWISVPLSLTHDTICCTAFIELHPSLSLTFISHGAATCQHHPRAIPPLQRSSVPLPPPADGLRQMSRQRQVR